MTNALGSSITANASRKCVRTKKADALDYHNGTLTTDVLCLSENLSDDELAFEKLSF